MKPYKPPKKTAKTISDIPEPDLKAALEQSEASYHGLFNTIRQAIYIQDSEGRFVDVNDGACAMYGYSREEFIGRTPEFLAAPGLNDFSLVTEKIRRAFAGEPQSFEFWARRRNGEIFPKDVSVYKGVYFGNQILIAVATEITEKKRVERALHESEEYYRAIINTSPDNITITDLSGKILMVSPASIAMFGLPDLNAAHGKNILDFVVPEEEERIRQAVALVLKTGVALGEFSGRRVDGSIFPFEAHASLMWDRKGNPWRLAIFVRDISGRKQLEETLSRALSRSQNQQQVIAEISASPLVSSGEVDEFLQMITKRAASVLGVERAGVWIFDDTQTRLSCRDLFESTPGTHTSGTVLLESEFRNEFAALRSAKFINADDPLTDPRTAGYVEGYLKPLKITSMLNAVIRIAGKNIGVICFEHVETPHHWEPDECTFACQLSDQIAFAVTNRERVAAQQVLVESDERYRAFLSHSNEGIFRFEAGCDIPVTLPEDDQIALFIEHGYLAECNDAYARMFGYEKAVDLIGAGIGRMMELDGELTLDYMHTFIRSGYRLENYESMETDREGNSHWFSNTLTGILRDGKIVRIWGVQRDITDHRNAEQQLEESEAKFRFLTEKMNDIVWTTDLGFRTTYVSPSVVKILGFTPEERMQQEVTEQLAPASMILARSMLTQAIESQPTSPPEPERTYNLPLEFCHKNGSTVWLECLISGIRNEKGVLTGIHGVSRDITDRRKAEEQLAESESFNRGLVENMPDYIAVYGQDGKLVYVNPASARGLEYEPDMLVGTHVLNYVAEEDRDTVAARMAARQTGGDTSPYEIDMVSRTGLRRSVIVKATPIIYQNNPAILLLLLDITQRKKAEEALLESEERYRTLIDQLPDYVLVHRNGILLYVNPAAASRLGYDEKKFIGKSLLPFIAPEYHDTIRKAISQRMTDEGFPSYEIKIIAGDGSYHTVLVNGSLITFEGEPASLNVLTDITSLKLAEEAIRSANEDLEKRVAERTEALILANEQLIAEITARTKAEQEITRSLKEKDLLLREIHHRVKNNLQIVASLLKLQSRYITDPNVLESIRDSQSRVRAMALVHERIYRSHNIAEINLKDYLNYLTKQIFSFYNIPHNRVGILVTMDEIMANIDTIIPVGLIVNELVTNSLKHAFSDGRKGTISIEGTAQGVDMLRLVYRDSGAGMPVGFDWNNSETLGLRLVNDLVNQLNGTIAAGTGPGTTLIITVQQKRDPAPS